MRKILFLAMLATITLSSCNKWHMNWALQNVDKIASVLPTDSTIVYSTEIQYRDTSINNPADTTILVFETDCPDQKVSDDNEKQNVEFEVKDGKAKIRSICKEEEIKHKLATVTNELNIATDRTKTFATELNENNKEIERLKQKIKALRKKVLRARIGLGTPLMLLIAIFIYALIKK